MRGCWIDAGDNPNPRLMNRWGIRRVCFAAAVDNGDGAYVPNPMLTRAYLDGWRSAFGSVGIYRAGNWPGVNGAPLSAKQLALALDADLALGGANDRQCEVHLNAEAHDFDLLGFLAAWRHLRPQRETTWVIEPLQGGRITAPQVAAINADVNLRVMAETFTGSMEQLDADSVRCNLIDYGIRRERALLMYDAAHLGAYFDGCAFTQGRLPG